MLAALTPDPNVIADAGPWAVVVAVLIAGFLGFMEALRRKLIVPGWIFSDERSNRTKAERQAEANAKALQRLAAKYESLDQHVGSMDDAFTKLLTTHLALLERVANGGGDDAPS